MRAISKVFGAGLGGRNRMSGCARCAEFPFGSLANPVRVMITEHESAGSSLEQIRKVTSDYTLPAHACQTYRALFEGLQQLEGDLHTHIHLENNILFPRALALQA